MSTKKFNFGFPTANKKKDEPKRKLGDGSDDERDTRKRVRSTVIAADDEDDFLASAGIKITPNPTKKVVDDDDEEDPLDAFMADMNEQAKSTKTEIKAQRDDLEEEDEIESYVRHMKEKGITVGKPNDSQAIAQQRDEDVNSDDEVYATAAALDNDSDDGESGPVKREIEPLARINHDEIQYPDIEKYFYNEHAEIGALTSEQVSEIRRELGLHVSGFDPPKPCISFAHFGFDDKIMGAIIKAGYTEPSAIQKQAVPVALEGRDIIGIAKTGSGKTAAFVLPMLVHIMDQEELKKGDGPIGLILAPTRELAVQIYSETKKFAKAYGLTVAAVYGGASKMDQFKQLRSGKVEILVATPGRLIDMIKMKATNLTRVSYLVLDEADRMFDLGFEPQVRSICDNIRPDRQALLFSATFPKRVESLAREVTDDPIRISVGTTGQANEDITQVITIFEDELMKWDWLMQRLPGFCAEGNVIIFVSRKGAVDVLASNLNESGFDCGALHGDLMQYEREKVLRDFRANKFTVLVATDVAARGLDIKSVKNVVNYDIARDIDSHVHRIGRTGRAGEKGTAYTLMTKKDDRFAGDLVRNLESSGQPVSMDLMNLAMSNPRFRSSRTRGGRGRGRGLGSRGRGRGRDGRFHGRGEHGMTGANAEPLPSRNSGMRSSSFAPMNFRRATTDEAGAQGLSTVSGSQQHHNQYKQQQQQHPHVHQHGNRASRWR
ncbi:P-loop containing nucleoside triphosphate hydrolase protein [Dichotomocladium elegans]|nr:P-loop containing nucleoside triphosphate hydrolase protein [Dichotomocladium elegans]